MIMSALVTAHKSAWLMSKKDRKLLRKTVRVLEREMQYVWEFEIDNSKHTHWMRFDWDCPACVIQTESISGHEHTLPRHQMPTAW